MQNVDDTVHQEQLCCLCDKPGNGLYIWLLVAVGKMY